jgi:putative ABC transport system permease protein
MTLRQGLILVLVGVVLGLAGALGITYFLSSQLFEVTPTDPVTFASVTLLLTGIALMACYLPSRRAAKIEPMVALRYE